MLLAVGDSFEDSIRFFLVTRCLIGLMCAYAVFIRSIEEDKQFYSFIFHDLSHTQ